MTIRFAAPWALVVAINLLGASLAWAADLPAFHIRSGALYFDQRDQSIQIDPSANRTLALPSGTPLQIMSGLDERGFVHLAISARLGGQFWIFGREVRLREGGTFYANVAQGRPLELRVAWQHADVTNSAQREDPTQILAFLTSPSKKETDASNAAAKAGGQDASSGAASLVAEKESGASTEPSQSQDPRILRADRLAEVSFPPLDVLLQPAVVAEKEPITQRKPGSRN